MADELDDQLDYRVDSEPEEASLGQFSDTEETAPKRLPHIIGDKTDRNLARKRQAPELAPAEAKKLKAEKQKARSRLRMKQKRQMKNMQDIAVKSSLGKTEPAMIADYIVGLVSRTDEKLSGIELQDRAVPESAIVNTAEIDMDRHPENLPKYFEALGLDDFVANELVIVLCLSVDRIGVIARMLNKVNKHGVLTLTKENTYKHDAETLQRSKSHIAVATPGRVQRLLDMEAIKHDQIKRVVVDSSVLDAKQRSLWEFKETIPLVSDLTRNHGVKIFLF